MIRMVAMMTMMTVVVLVVVMVVVVVVVEELGASDRNGPAEQYLQRQPENYPWIRMTHNAFFEEKKSESQSMLGNRTVH